MEEIAGIVAGVATGGISSLVGGALGVFARLGAAWFSYKTQARDQEHEREMTRLLTEREEKLSGLRVREATVAGELKVDETWAAALREAVAARPSGVGWVDAWNTAMRPGITTYVFVLYGLYKGAAIACLWVDGMAWRALTYLWTADDAAMLFSIASFWFLDRSLRRKGV
jgi:hypothetical protein